MSPTMKALSAIGLSLMFLVVSYWVSSLSDPAVVSWSNRVALSTYMLGTPFTALVVWWFMLTGRRGRLSSSQGPSLVAGLGFMLSAFWLHFALGVFCNHVEGDASFDATYEPVVALATGIDLLMLLVIVLCTWQVAFPRASVHGCRRSAARPRCSGASRCRCARSAVPRPRRRCRRRPARHRGGPRSGRARRSTCGRRSP